MEDSVAKKNMEFDPNNFIFTAKYGNSMLVWKYMSAVRIDNLPIYWWYNGS